MAPQAWHHPVVSSQLQWRAARRKQGDLGYPHCALPGPGKPGLEVTSCDERHHLRSRMPRVARCNSGIPPAAWMTDGIVHGPPTARWRILPRLLARCIRRTEDCPHDTASTPIFHMAAARSTLLFNTHFFLAGAMFQMPEYMRMRRQAHAHAQASACVLTL